jgi:hypothetical protein
MERYQLDNFPFEDPDIARALSHALAVLLWNTPAPPPAARPAKRRTRRKQAAGRRQQPSTREADNQK